MGKFYVYVYFDPRSQGDYNILGEVFKYKPIYVGKGRGSRVLKHINTNKQTKLINLNKHLIGLGLMPHYKILKEFEKEEDAHMFEKTLIKDLGREDLKQGPLFNLTDGGEGSCGRVWSEEEKNVVSIRSSNYWNSISVDGRRLHGFKSKDNRTYNGKNEGIKKRKQTTALWSEGYKMEIKNKRLASWLKNYCNTEEKQKQRSNKCKQASLKRLMYYLTYLKTDGTYESGFLKDLIAAGWGKDAIEWRIKGKIPLDKPYTLKSSNEIIKIIKVEKKSYLSS
jgi:hypothetical protein